MKKSIIKKFLKVNKNNPITDDSICSFLIGEGKYLEDYRDMQLESFYKFIDSLGDKGKLSREAKDRSDKNNSSSMNKNPIKTLKMIENENHLDDFIKSVSHYIKLDKSNLEEIRGSFSLGLKNIQNYKEIDHEKLFNFSELLGRKTYLSKDKYKTIIYLNDYIVYLTIFDILTIILGYNTFSEQVEYLNNLFNYDEFDQLIKEDYFSMCDSNKDVLDRLDNGQKLKRIKKVMDFAIVHSKNSFNSLNINSEGDYFFFLPSSIVSENLGMAQSSVQEYLRFSAVLGLINTVSYETVSIEEDIRINKANAFKKVNLYSFSDLDSKYQDVDNMIELCRKEKITMKKITKNFLKNRFGEEFSEKIYRK